MKSHLNGFFIIVAMALFLALLDLIESSSVTKTESQSDCQDQNSGDVEIKPNAEYFIYNKKYLNARLSQWGESSRSVGTYARSEMDECQLWKIEESTADIEDYFIIRNVKRPKFRLAKWGEGDKEIGVYDAKQYHDQLWKFVKFGKYYRIYNYRYPKAKLAKFGSDDGDFGTYSKDDHEDQLWRLVPRYQAASVDSIILHIRNGGSKSITEQRTVTVGVTVEDEKSVSATVGFTASVSVSLKGIFEASSELSTQISSKISSKDTTTWSTTSTINYEIKPRTEYTVYQRNYDFDSPLGGFSFLSNYEVREKKI